MTAGTAETSSTVATGSTDRKQWQALAVLGIAFLMVILDVAIVNVALPSIQHDLHFSSASSLQWVVSGYALTYGGLILLGGRLGDILGRRRVFMVGLAAFATFSLLCGLSTSPTELIVFRLLQGAAGAILTPSVFSITTVTFAEGSERNRALGILGGIAGSGVAIGVLLGGVLTQYAGWKWIFFVNVPIGVLALVLVPLFVRESRATELARRFDVTGAISITSSLMLLVFALTRAPTVGWGSAQVLGSLIGSAVLMGAFVVTESRSRSPLVPLGIFKRRTLTGANVIGFLLGASIFGMFFLLSLYMQQILGFSAIRTGVGYLALALTVLVASGIAQALVTRLGVKPVLATGMILIAVGQGYFTQISVNGSYFADLFPGFILLGVGMGFCYVPISVAALAGATSREAGLQSGLINTMQQIGGAVGLAILTTVAITHTNHLLNSGVSHAEASTRGYSLAFWVGVGFALVGLAATLLLLMRDDLPVNAAEPQPVAVGEPA
jgi:EmrB/QacA subfamily drug resistance transporter